MPSSLSKNLIKNFNEDKAFFHTLIDTLSDLIWIKDVDGIYLTCNTPFERFFGATREEIIGKTDFDFVDKELATFFRKYDLEAIERGSPNTNHEWITLAENGNNVFLETTKTPIVDEHGEIVGVLGVGRDITQIEKTQKERDIFREIVSNSPDMIFVLDTAYRIVAANENYAKHHNMTSQMMVGQHIKSITGDTFFDTTIKEPISRAFNGEKSLYTSHVNPENIEKTFIYEVTYLPNVIKDGTINGCIVTIHDITEKELALEEIKHYQFLLNQSQKTLKIGSWELNLISNKLWWSDEIFRIFDIDPEMFEASYESFLNAIHPDDRERVNQAYMNSLKSGEPYEITHRLLLGNNVIKYVTEKCHTDFDDEGKPLRSVGTVHDVTQENKTMEKLQQAATVIEHTTESIMITDENNRVIAINPAFEKMCGYTREEMMGNPPSILKSGRHDKNFYKEMWHAINTTGSWQGELWNRRKNGEIYPEWRTITAIKESNGSVVNYVGIASDISELKESQEELHYLSQHDPLTDLPNRVLLQARMQHSIDTALRSQKLVAVCFLDIDNFKNINDTFGHNAGDMILKETAQRLLNHIRSDDTLSRFGGDEFVIVLNSISSPSDILTVVNHILEIFLQPFDVGGISHHLSASIGISIYPNDSKQTEELIKFADSAMYRAKEEGKNGYAFYTQEITQNMFEKILIENNLREALQKKQFELYYQPQIDMATHKIVGMEALIRWKHPQLGMISPAKFIPSAEESRLIIPMGDWILQEACTQLKKWHHAGIYDGRVAINISGVQFDQDHFLTKTIDTIKDSGIDTEFIELEITESSLMKDPNKWLSILKKLEQAGVTLSIDDFGTGYSSLSYLRQLPVHTLKVDQSFVADLPEDDDACAIANAVIALAKSMKMTALAEGIETLEQLEYLKENGCDIAQGYYFSRPLSTIDMEKKLREGGAF
jgi:diguanylate cyclase (GGDEF)-like protein/PAS domain S-box-containing protein